MNNLESSLPSITSDVNDDIFENIQLLPDMANNLDVDENLIDSTLWEVLDRQQAESSEDQPIFLNSPSLLTFMNGYMRILDENGRRMVQTVEHVALSIDAVFGDQIRAWTLCMDQGMNFAETPVRAMTNRHCFIIVVKDLSSIDMKLSMTSYTFGLFFLSLVLRTWPDWNW